MTIINDSGIVSQMSAGENSKVYAVCVQLKDVVKRDVCKAVFFNKKEEIRHG